MKLTEKQKQALDNLVIQKGKPGAARLLGVSRQTIYNVLAGTQGLRYDALTVLDGLQTVSPEAPEAPPPGRELERLITEELPKLTEDQLKVIYRDILLQTTK